MVQNLSGRILFQKKVEFLKSGTLFQFYASSNKDTFFYSPSISRHHSIATCCVKYNSRYILVDSTDRASSQQLEKCGFLNIISRQNLLRSLSPLLFLLRWNKYGAKNVWTITFHSTLRWFNFSQSGSKKNNRKAFEGTSMKPTTQNKNKRYRQGKNFGKKEYALYLGLCEIWTASIITIEDDQM